MRWLAPSPPPAVEAPEHEVLADGRAAAEEFRVRHMVAGLVIGASALLMAVVYVLLGGLAGARPRDVYGILGFAALSSLGFAVLALRAARSARYLPFFVALSVWAIVLILVLVALDGGSHSVMVDLLFFTMLFAGLAYPPRVVAVLGALAIAGYLAVSAGTGTLTLRVNYPVSCSLGLATVMAAMAARNREHQDRQLQAMARLLEAEATHDRLTECLNRRGVEPILSTEVARASRYKRPLSVLLVDLDRLKEINDSLGHGAGDMALQEVGEAVRSVCRDSDFAARLGGDEFLVVTPETTRAEAWAIGERIRGVLFRSDSQLRVTVSIGVAQLSEAEPTVEALLREADANLYLAKASGRDCTSMRRDFSGAAPA